MPRSKRLLAANLLLGCAALAGCADSAIVTSRPVVRTPNSAAAEVLRGQTTAALATARQDLNQARTNRDAARTDLCNAHKALAEANGGTLPEGTWPDEVDASTCPPLAPRAASDQPAPAPDAVAVAAATATFGQKLTAFGVTLAPFTQANRAYERALAADNLAASILASDPRATAEGSRARRDSSGDSPYGLAYFLPRQLATVTARRTPSALAKAVSGVTKAQTALDAAIATLSERQRAVAVATDAITNAPDRSSTRNLLDRNLDEAVHLQEAAMTAVTEARTKMGEAKTKLEEEAKKPLPLGAGQFDLTLTITLNPPTADPNFAFRLNPEHSDFRDDQHKFTIGSSGLLSTANVVSVDRTGDVLVELATFAGMAMGSPATAGFNGESSNQSCANAPTEFVGQVDLASVEDINVTNGRLLCLGVQLNIDAPAWAATPLPEVTADGPPLQGIVYRTPMERVVTVMRCTSPANNCSDGTGWAATQQLAFTLPQAGPISVLRQDADALTRTSYDLAFDNGIPTSYSSNRPSTALEVARLPVRAIEGVFNGISRIISLRIGQANSQTALSTAQLNLLNQQTQYDLAVASSQQQLAIQELNNQQALALAGFTNQQALVTAQQQLAAAQAQFAQAQIAAQQALALAGVNNQTSLAQAQQQLANTQTQNSIAQLGAPGQIASAQFAAEVAALREQNLRAQLERCVAGVIAATPAGSTPDIAPCLAGL